MLMHMLVNEAESEFKSSDLKTELSCFGWVVTSTSMLLRIPLTGSVNLRPPYTYESG